MGAKKKILITGAGTGLGHGVAMRLAQMGHKVFAGVEIRPQISQLRAEAEKLGVDIFVEKLDMRSERDRDFAARWGDGEIDVLLSNAGYGEAGAITDIPVQYVSELFDNNVFGPMKLVQKIAPGMIERRRGRLVFVSSVAGFFSAPFNGPYCMTKHAIEAMAEALWGELGRFNIEVATINPGPYQTGFNDRLQETWMSWYDKSKSPFDYEAMELQVFPMKQYDPEEMIQRMVEICDADPGQFLYRNILPKAVEDFIKQQQNSAWTRKPLFKE